MGLSIVIPVRNIPDATNECIDLLVKNSLGDIDIIIIDNGSDIPYTNNSPFVRVIRNNKNIGFWPSMLQGMDVAHYNIVLAMHNDCFIYSPAFDQLILKEFEADPLLCTAGFFGGKGVGFDGSRGYPMGRMQGRKYGQSQDHHGYWIDTPTPAIVFDSLAMIFRRDLLQTLEPATIPPHHWSDRIVSLRTFFAGYHSLCIPVEFDHGGSFTAVGTNALNTFTEDWCRERGLELNQTWDNTLYQYGLQQFQREWISAITDKYDQIWLDKDYNVLVREKP